MDRKISQGNFGLIIFTYMDNIAEHVDLQLLCEDDIEKSGIACPLRSRSGPGIISSSSDNQSCEMSQIWQIYLCKFFGGLG